MTGHLKTRITKYWAGAFNGLITCLLILDVTFLTLGAVPQAPRPVAKPLNCDGVVAFSAVTDGSGTLKNKPIPFPSVFVAKTPSYNPKTGIFTTQCPGVYQFTFSGSGDILKLSLRRRPSSATAAWSVIVETGPKGGTQTVILPLEVNEEIGVFLDTGTLISSPGPKQTFSGFRIAQK